MVFEFSSSEITKKEQVKMTITDSGENNKKEAGTQKFEKVCDSSTQESVEIAKEKPDPTCPICFKMLLNSEKMKLHIKECHGNEEIKKTEENTDSSLKLT